MDHKGKRLKTRNHICMCTSMLFAVIFLATMLCLNGTAKATELIDPSAGFGIVEQNGIQYVAVAVQRDTYTAVYTANGNASQSAQSDFMWHGQSYPLSPDEGDIFQGGGIYSWKTEARIEDSGIPNCSYPVYGQTVTAVYYNQDTALRTETAQLTDRRDFNDGTALLSVYPAVSEAVRFPGMLLDQEGNCVGILFREGGAYSAWYNSGEFQNTELPETPEDKWWETTAGIAGITVAVVAAAGLVLFFVTRNAGKKPVKPTRKMPAIPSVKPSDNRVNEGRGTVSIALVFTSGDLNGAYFPVCEGVTTIGRNQSCTVRLPANIKGVSRMHAELCVKEGDIALRDTSSTGTYLNNMESKLTPNQPTRIHVGDTIFLGSKENRATIVQNHEHT